MPLFPVAQAMKTSNPIKIEGVSMQFYTTPGETVWADRFEPLHVFHTWTKRRICGSVTNGGSGAVGYLVRTHASAN